MGRETTAATVSRRYSEDETSCEEAVRLLLDFAKKEKKGGPDNRPDDARKESNHHSRGSIIR